MTGTPTCCLVPMPAGPASPAHWSAPGARSTTRSTSYVRRWTRYWEAP